jgi:uncharacterized protein (DUF885 family)
MTTPRISRRKLSIAIASSCLLPVTSWPAAASGGSGNPRLAQIAEAFYRGMLSLFPIEATENVGDPAFDAAFEIDISPAHRERQRLFYERTLSELRAVNVSQLGRDDRVTHELLTWDATDRLALMAFPRHLMPIIHADSMPVRMAQWASGKGSQTLRTSANFDHFLARLERLPEWIDQAIANMRDGVAKGIVLPRAIVERTLPQLDALLPADIAESPFLAGTREFPPGVPEADRTRLRKGYADLVQRSLVPAVSRLRDYMRNDYLPASRLSSGLGALNPAGDWYRLLVRSFTTSDMGIDEIHELGLREVARIRSEMEAVKARMGFEGGDLAAFFKWVNSRPEFSPFRSDEEVLAAYRAINARVSSQLPRLFERAPRAPLEIRAVEGARRDTASSYYVPPALDGSRPGVFFAAFAEPRAVQTPSMTALFLHEGQPGHHYQMALQQEIAHSDYRRSLWYDALGEGWALYAEGLGSDLGVYDTASAWLGRLQLEMLRALRLVVDTGLHAKGWSRERAIAYSREHDGSGEDDARRAIERYMAWPGQALAYKVGELKILQLRQRAKARLGPKFDIRRFHSQVLADGCVPLKMLEATVNSWLESGQA